MILYQIYGRYTN